MKAIIHSTDYELKATAARLLAARHPPITLVNELPGMIKPSAGITVLHPDIILFDARGDQQEALEALEQIAARHPQAAILLLAPIQSPELLIAAMRAGVREVVGMPLNLTELDQALERVATKLRESQRIEGKVVSVISCKGGSGTTFVTTNLGYGLATLAQKKTLLIDLNLQFGDAALFISDTRPAMSLTDLCTQIQRLDAELLESSLVKTSPNFGVLAASSDPDPEDSVRPEHVDLILQLAKRHYDFILFDVGRQVNGVTIRALDASDVICPIVQQSLPYLRNGRRLLDMFTTLGYRRDKVQQIVNRHDSSAPIRMQDMEHALGHRIAYAIPNNFDIASESINQGTPVLQLARSSNLSKGFVDLVNSLTDTPASGSPGIIRRLFVRNPVHTQ